MESQPEFKLIKSSRGGLKLSEGGYIYDKQRIHGELTHWQCEKKGVCKARLHTKEMSIMKQTNEHLHGPDYHLVTCLETKVGIKRKAQDTQATTHQIIGENVMAVIVGAAAKFPN